MAADVSRREFVTLTAAGSLGLLLGLPAGRPRAQAPHAGVLLHPLIHIGTDGDVTLFAQNPEMGQGVKTSLPMIVAEELDVDWREIRIVQADWDPALENQFSGGSLSVRLNFTAMRRAGASAREMLMQAAAARWNVSRSALATAAGQVEHRSTGRALGYGALADAAAALPVPEQPALKPAADFQLIGRSVPDVDLTRIVRGQQVYSLDLELPDMLYAVVKRCPVSDGQPVSFDGREAEKVDGVVGFRMLRNRDFGGRIILPNNPNFVSGVAVLAERTWAALEGARRLRVEWELPKALDDSAQLMSRYEDALMRPGEVVRSDGDAETASGAAAIQVDETYRLPFLAHVPMEPMNCTADVGSSDGIVIWAPTQNPEQTAMAVARALDVAPERITVKVMRSGGAFGRRFYGDFAVDAAILSQQMQRPVKVVWTREDDIRHDYFRPSGLHRVKAGMDENGRISAWHHKLVNHSRATYLERDGSPAEIGDYEFPAGFVPNLHYEYVLVPSRIPLGQWRAVDHSANVFVFASVIDELARKAGADPVAVLRQLIGDQQYVQVREDFRFDASRLLHVVEEAARISGWGSRMGKGRGRGIAASYNQGSWVAEVAEVSVAGRKLNVERIVAVIDCGLVVNPAGAKAQVEGGIVEGLGAALMGEITVEAGSVQQGNFNDYPICRMHHVPSIEIRLIDSDEEPRGLGEPPLPPVAPAVCNAIFDASGIRIRELPITRHLSI
jgi:isoquinoline 1-oxidoreductase subunit beta